jgi:hypothetical protein
MFEGSPIHSIFLTGAPFLGLISIGILGLTVWLRWAFPREWQLLLWSGTRPSRTWCRRLDEAPRTGGVVLSHVIGLLMWPVFGVLLESQWQFNAALIPDGDQPWDSLLRWSAIGFVVFLANQCHRYFGTWLTLLHDTVERALEWQRHYRVWTAWTLTLGIVPVVFHPLLDSLLPLAMLAGALIIFKWLRLLQLVFVMRLPVLWGIAYICTLEIAPTILLWITCFPD